jgi:hypothetical protein
MTTRNKGNGSHVRALTGGTAAGEPYKSPPRKLLRLFNTSRAQWKAKCRAAKATIKVLKNRIRFLEESRARWKRRAQALEQEVARRAATGRDAARERHALKKKGPEPGVLEAPHGAAFALVPVHHQYSVGTIGLFLALVLTVATGLRCASRVLALWGEVWEHPEAVPAWETGRWWVLRVGYYKLTRPKAQAADWVWIVDHTYQLGRQKCLVILGLRLSALPPRGQCLRHEDVEPLVLEPAEQSNGDIVYHQLKATIKKTGVPREIIRDRGGDVQAGVEHFCAAHPTTCAIYAIKHKTAAVLKQELAGDPAWQEFTHLCQQTKQQVQQTALAFLMPPNQRTTARWMNVARLVDWGTKTLAFLDTPPPTRAPGCDTTRLEEKLGWLPRFRPQLQLWGELLHLVEVTEHFVRTQGLTRGAPRQLRHLLTPLTLTPRGHKVRTHLLAFVAEEALKVQPHERLLGSSEVIESVFGKFKRLEATQGKSGFTGLLLTIGAMVAHTTHEIIHKALETVPTKCVLEWCKKTLGDSIQAQRKKAFGLHSRTEQNCHQEQEAA